MPVSWIESVSNLSGPFKASDSRITDFRLNYHEDCPLGKTTARNIDLVELGTRALDFRSYAENSRDAAKERIAHVYWSKIRLLHLPNFNALSGLYEHCIAQIALYNTFLQEFNRKTIFEINFFLFLYSFSYKSLLRTFWFYDIRKKVIKILKLLATQIPFFSALFESQRGQREYDDVG